MESFLPQGGFQRPFQRRLSRLYNDTKKSSDFVQEPVQAADDPEIKALHRKLRIQKDRLVSWGLEWSDPNQAAEIDESLSKAGLSDLVGSIMATIKDILAEAEPLWLASKRLTGAEKASEKASGDRKTPLIVWDKGRFEDLVKDLTASIDTLCDLSRTRSSATLSPRTSKLDKSNTSMEDLRPYGSTRIQTPQQIDPRTLTSLRSMQAMPLSETDTSQNRPQDIFFMNKQAYSELTRGPGRQPWSPLLVEYAKFDPIYSMTGIMPDMSRFEKLSAGLQTESYRAPGTWIGLPLLLGYYEDIENSRLALIYQFPPTFNPVTFENLTQNPLDNLCTLAELLNRPDFEPTLEAKFRLAYNLANTVFDMHSRGITHGNIHGATISFCSPVGNEPGMSVDEVDVRRPLISSFDVFPEPSTPYQPSSAFLLHRHPLDPRTTSQSPLASRGDTKTLDLYSLAMILVSIGLWTTLENLTPGQGSPSISESVLEQLAIRCGTPYMRAVQACWNAVDRELAYPDNTEEIISQVQIRASRYLEACCILDGVSGLDERLGDEYAKPSSREKADTSVASLPGSSVKLPTTHEYDTKQMTGQELLSHDDRNIRIRPEGKTAKAKTEPSQGASLKLRLYPQIPLPTEILEQWNNMVMPQINLALRHFYRKNPESVEISLESIGESPQSTTPTVLVVCTSVNKVRAILKKKLGVLFDGTTGFSLKVCHGSVMRSRKGPTRSMAKDERSKITGNQDDSEDEARYAAANPSYQERPQNGASIGAWIGDKHLPPVSFGGLIIVDDKPYGMTVHHMLDDPDRPALPLDEPAEYGKVAKRAGAAALHNSALGYGMVSLHEGDSSEESSADEFTCEFSDSESEYSVTDITSDDEEDDEEDEEFTEPGDIPGVEPGCGDGYVVTQPALDDVEEGFYPSEETKDEDHLDSYSLGEVYASSGIRRRSEDGLIHEIDWALFGFHDDRLPQENLISTLRAATKGSSSSTAFKTLQPKEVVPANALPGLQVQCNARTSGLQAGQIMPALTSVKIYGRTSPSHTYQVTSLPSATNSHKHPTSSSMNRIRNRHSPPLGAPGDSGAWLIDSIHGRVCGHVLAWSERKQVAYICPMDVLLRDIAETLEATEVRLPGGEAFFKISTGGGNIEEIIEVSDPESWVEGDDEEFLQPHSSHEAHDGRELRVKHARGSKRSSPTRPEESFGGSVVPGLAVDMGKMHLHDAGMGYGKR
ncbi:hypothetical protein F5X99DRAFT_71854 [Biscogniauxia marginata]|nr:hypothetical protein F5X99DRAFT_71854 [Biscogniauxia marginata]